MEEKNKPHDSLREAFEETKAGNLKRAIEIYDDILSKNPEDSDALVNKSITLMNSKRYDESLVCLSTISHESSHGFDKMLIEASCLFSLGEDEKALKQYQKILTIDSTNGIVNISLYQYYIIKGDKEKEFEPIFDTEETYIKVKKLQKEPISHDFKFVPRTKIRSFRDNYCLICENFCEFYIGNEVVRMFETLLHPPGGCQNND